MEDNGSQTTATDVIYQSSENQRDSGSQISADKHVRTIAAVAHHDRLIIEWCCGHSLLGLTSKYSDGCEVIRFAIDDDLRVLAGLQKALRVINQRPKGRTLLWGAMPCAGGSPWQTLNIALGVGLEKIEARYFRVLWGNFVIAAEAVIDIDGIVAIEWPERCKYWLDPRVGGFLKKHQFDQSVFHGCACGLVTKYNEPLHKPMKKPWRCFSNNFKMLIYFNRKCLGNHTHAECRGEDCKASEDYTPDIIDAIHMGFVYVVDLRVSVSLHYVVVGMVPSRWIMFVLCRHYH
jgi:hypothetical protein